jgi:lysyl-tRNA synthetase class 2
VGERPAWRPAATPQRLALRAELLRKTRAFFDFRGFCEVETPLLSQDAVVDRALDPFAVQVAPGETRYLQTSPEFCMKRLLAAGAKAIYQTTRAFRREERGALHNPEFTIVEWYRAGDDYAAGMELLSQLCDELLPFGPASRLSYGEAFLEHVGIDPHLAGARQLAEAAKSAGIAAPASLADDDRDGWLNLLLAERVEARLGVAQPTILYDYPASQAALARIRDDAPPVAERFELYVRGIELANGYHELLDPAVLRERNRAQNAARLLDGKESLPEASRLALAMDRGLPACAGVALGFDRVVMLAAGASSLDEVLAFPWERA